MQLAQQGCRIRLGKQVDTPAVEIFEQVAITARLVVVVKQVDVVAPLFAPGSEQRLAVSIRSSGNNTGGLATVVVRQHVFVGDDIAPVVPAMVVHAQQHLAVA